MIRWLAMLVGLGCAMFGSGMIFVCTVATNEDLMQRLKNATRDRLTKIEDGSLIFIFLGLALIFVAFES